MSDFMIEARNLTKRYGAMLAADRVNFKVPRGSIFGFLGPNGAGKSTTMRMLSCFMPPTSGTAKVAGHDILDDSIGVRRKLGYLPESTPLYLDMRVREYLNFRAKIKGVPRRERKGRIEYVLDRCGIVNVKNRIIGHLSKGYRQRVGLADALVHEPEVLILDEPTVGLDPMQIREVRSLIKALGEERTVLLSTHILPEVEMICDSVVIIRRGRIILSEKLDAITTRGVARLVVALKGPCDGAREALGNLQGVHEVHQRESAGLDGGEETELVLHLEPGLDLREAAFKLVSSKGWTLVGLRQDVPRLEEIFLRTVIGEEEEVLFGQERSEPAGAADKDATDLQGEIREGGTDNGGENR